MGYNVIVRHLCYVLLIFFSLAVFRQASWATAATPAPVEVRHIVSKIVAAYGGKRVIESIKSVYAEGGIEALMHQDHGTYKLFFKRPRKLRVEAKYTRSSETRILNGDRGYTGADGSPLSRAEGASLLATLYQYKNFDLPYGLLKGAYSITEKGKEDLNGKPVEILHLADREGPPMDVYVDTRTFFVVKVTGYFAMGGGSTALSAEFSDFRKVDGMVFPFRIANYAGGYKIAETTMNVYRINAPMPDSLFAP